MSRITLLGEPRSTGSIYKIQTRGKFATTYVTKEGKTLKASYQKQAKEQWKDKIIEREVRIEMFLWFGTKRRCDIDNFNKLAFDSLTGIVWNDDSQIKLLTIRKLYDKENPRIELDIYELPM